MTHPTDIAPDYFYNGLALPEYIEGMTKNRDLFEANYEGFQLNEDELTALHALGAAIHILVVTEDWCGDSARYLPALARMAEVTGQWDIRIFYRDTHPELAGRWLKHGTRSAIPVLVFFDEEWHEYACFVEKPDLVYQEEIVARADFAHDHPDLPDAALPADQMSQPTLDVFAPYMRGFRLTNTARWQHLFAQELIARLQSALAGQPSASGCW